MSEQMHETLTRTAMELGILVGKSKIIAKLMFRVIGAPKTDLLALNALVELLRDAAHEADERVNEP